MPYKNAGRLECVLKEPYSTTWKNLRAGLLYFCRVSPLPDIAQTVGDAVSKLRSYAAAVEHHLGHAHCKFNLHLLLCRLAPQEEARGKVAYSTEYWVENLIQWAKSIVRYRTTKYPELVLVNDMLIDDALARWLVRQPDLIGFMEEWLPDFLTFKRLPGCHRCRLAEANI